MLQKKLNNNTKIPVIGLGTWKLESRDGMKMIQKSLEIGYRHIDTAPVYGNEKEIGKAISSFPREELYLTTKLWYDIQDPKKVEKACDQSLNDLKTSYVDLYLLHWPNKNTFLDILAAMQALIEKGKVRTIGISNGTINHLQKILDRGLKISMNQVELHPFFNQKKLLDFCTKHQIAVTAYRPFANGKIFENAKLQQIGAQHNKTPAQITLRWLVQKGIIAIPKGGSEDHLRENFTIFDFHLSDEEMALIDSLNIDQRLVTREWNEFDY